MPRVVSIKVERLLPEEIKQNSKGNDISSSSLFCLSGSWVANKKPFFPVPWFLRLLTLFFRTRQIRNDFENHHDFGWPQAQACVLLSF